MISLTNDELRALVRDAIARARGNPASTAAPASLAPLPSPAPEHAQPAAVHVHASHVTFMLGRGGDADGNCIIEPAVRCTHCGYCQSYGH